MHLCFPPGLSDERVLSLQRSLNELLETHPDARRRSLSWHTPAVIPVWPQVRLVEDNPAYCTYGDAYDVHCARYGRDTDAPINLFKNRCCNASGTLVPDPSGVLRLQV